MIIGKKNLDSQSSTLHLCQKFADDSCISCGINHTVVSVLFVTKTQVEVLNALDVNCPLNAKGYNEANRL